MLKVLFIEDNPGDVRLTKMAMDELDELGGIPITLQVCPDGEDALCFLRKSGKYSAEELPDIILLDLNIPKRSGMEVLEIIKSTAEWQNIPVVILSTSGSVQDIATSYRLQCNSYISKPVDIDRFIDVLKKTSIYWSSLISIP